MEQLVQQPKQGQAAPTANAPACQEPRPCSRRRGGAGQVASAPAAASGGTGK